MAAPSEPSTQAADAASPFVPSSDRILARLALSVPEGATATAANANAVSSDALLWLVSWPFQSYGEQVSLNVELLVWRWGAFGKEDWHALLSIMAPYAQAEMTDATLHEKGAFSVKHEWRVGPLWNVNAEEDLVARVVAELADRRSDYDAWLTISRRLRQWEEAAVSDELKRRELVAARRREERAVDTVVELLEGVDALAKREAQRIERIADAIADELTANGTTEGGAQ